MPFDHGLRLNNRQRIANAREKPIEANKNQSVDGAEGLFLRSGSPQNVYLLPQHPNFHLKRCPRPKQICDHPNNEPEKISHPARASPDSRSTDSQIEFTIGTGQFSGPEPFVHNPSLADFIITASGFEFSVHTAGATAHAVVDDSLVVWICHDVNRRAVISKIKTVVQPQSWYIDLATVELA
jgi:hypothetical protein